MSLLNQFIQKQGLENALLNPMQTQGIITALAIAPFIVPPEEWITMMWGNTETAPFQSHAALEQYAELITDLWNQTRAELVSHTWQWPAGCDFSDHMLVNQATRDFCEGFLLGWSLTQDDWQTLIPDQPLEESLIGGVLVAMCLLFEPEKAIEIITKEGGDAVEQIDDVFNRMPALLNDITQHALTLVGQ